MITIVLLEDDDIVEPNDWCRPLFNPLLNLIDKDRLTGSPINHAEWIQVKTRYEPGWWNRPVNELNFGLLKYEFIRGNPPIDHRVTNYDVCKW